MADVWSAIRMSQNCEPAMLTWFYWSLGCIHVRFC